MTPPSPTLPTKRAIRERLAEGELREAAREAVAYAEACTLAPVVNGLTLLQAQIEDYRRQWSSGQLSFEEGARAQARLGQSLLDWLDQLPEHPRPAGRKARLMDEDRFKNRLFLLLLLAKLTVLGWLYYQWQTGGFNQDQFMATAGLLAPAFAAYLSVMLADYLRAQREQSTHPHRRVVSGPLLMISFVLLPAYVLVLCWFINAKVRGDMSFTAMNTGLTLVESVLGGYVGQIVFSFFKKDS